MSTVDHRPSAPDTERPELPAPGAEGEPSARSTAWVLLVGGLLGAGAALTLLIDELALLVDPDHVPSCSIDAVLSCGSIMKSPQAEVLGFPNPIIGLVAFPVVAGLGFVGWLIAQSVAVIGALCPWCMLVWAVAITVFRYVTAHNLAHGRLAAGEPGRLVARHPARSSAATLLVVLAVLVASFPAWFAAPFTG